jgi:hypothetical protein
MTTNGLLVTAASYAPHTMRIARDQSGCAIRDKEVTTVNSFMKTLQTQRWDDHRYYHQSRINQSLHLVSAIVFVCAYVMLFIDPAVAGLLGWGSTAPTT